MKRKRLTFGEGVVLLGLTIGGGLAAGSAVYDHKTRFSNDRIWKNNTALIDDKIKSPTDRKLAYESLRDELKKLDGKSNEQRCRFAEMSSALLREGSKEKADAYIAQKSFEPYAECTEEGQLKSSVKGWNIAGAGAFLLGLGGLIASFFRKED